MFAEQSTNKIEADSSASELALVALQNIIKFSLLLVYPVLFAQQFGLRSENFISVSLIAAAISALLIGSRWGGQRFFPTQASIPYFAILIFVAHQTDLAHVMGATIIIGIFQILCSAFYYLLKPFFTQVFAGVILFALGIWAAVLGVSEFFHPASLGQIMVHGVFSGGSIDPQSACIGLITIFLILTAWFSKKFRPYCIMLGMVIGCFIGFFWGDIPSSRFVYLTHTSWFAIPHFFNPISFSFSWQYWLIFLLLAAYGTIEYFSLVTTQHMENGCYSKNNNLKISLRGNIASGCGVAISGLLGGFAQSPIPGSVGDMILTNTFSRKISYYYAAFLIIIAFIPKFSALLMMIPASVNGAALILMGSTMVMSALNMIHIPMLSSAGQKAVGYSIALGVLINIIPEFYHAQFFKWFTNPSILVCSATFWALTLIYYLNFTTHEKH